MERYFLGNNTGYGFCGLYEGELKTKKKVVLLKGGPGTGKSYILKNISKEARDRALDCEEWYCSGDPSSLDGVFIKDLNVAIVDATAPHAIGADYPILRDKIYDLASSLNKDLLDKNKDKIYERLKCKSDRFSSVNCHLRSALCHYKNAIRFEDGVLDKCAIRNYACAVALELNKERSKYQAEKNVRRKLFSRAICPNGNSEYFDFLRYKRIIRVEGSTAARNVFFEQVSYQMIEGSILLNPLEPNDIEGIFSESTAVVTDVGNYSQNVSEYIDLSKFAKKNVVSEAIDEYNSCVLEIAFAVEQLNEAREAHLGAEKYFIEAMDFDNNANLYEKIKYDVFE